MADKTKMSKKKQSKTATPKKQKKVSARMMQVVAVPGKMMLTKVNDIASPGLELDPQEFYDLRSEIELDETIFEVDKSRCVTQHERTKYNKLPVGATFVMRAFFNRPMERLVTSGDTVQQYCDVRGNYLSTKSTTIKFTNVSEAEVVIFATTAVTPNDIKNEIGGRTMLADNVTIPAGKSRTFTVNREKMYPYIMTDDDGRQYEHLFDGFFVVPDAPPQAQSDISNEVYTTDDGKTINKQRRIWSEDAEILKISIRTRYMVQQAPKTATLEKIPSHPLVFSGDWDVPYGHTVQTFISRKGEVTTNNRGLNVNVAYDVTAEGWKGLGLALREDPVTGTTFAYLAKFKTPVERKNALPGVPPYENWMSMTDVEKAEIKDFVRAHYPAFRARVLENDKVNVFIPGGQGFTYTASGMEISSVTSTLRWSADHGALVLWDFSRDAPVRFESGWAYPNYYQDWVACLPPKGYLIVNDPTALSLLTIETAIGDKYLVPSDVKWDLARLAITILIETVHGMPKIAAHMRSSR